MNKLKIFIVALISLSVVFTSCKTDEPKIISGDIEAKVSNRALADSIVDSVYVYVSDTDILLGEAKYENGGFKIKMSAVPLSALDSPFEDEEIPSGVNVSDKSVKIAAASFIGVKNNQEVGDFVLTKLTFDEIMNQAKDVLIETSAIMYIYADKDLRITGTATDTEKFDDRTITEKTTFNISIKQGWNLVAVKTVVNNESNFEVEIFTLVSSKGYNWVFIPNADNDDDNSRKNKWDEVDAQVTNGAMFNSMIDSVYVHSEGSSTLLGKAKYTNGGFKMTLSAMPADDLVPFGYEAPEGITMSDKDAQIGGASLFKGIKNGELVGTFMFTNLTMQDFMSGSEEEILNKMKLAMYMYVDRDVTIEGSDIQTFTSEDENGNELRYTVKASYDLTLQQGWNLITVKTKISHDSQEVEVKSLTDTEGYNWLFFPGDMIQTPKAKIFKREFLFPPLIKH